jgi:tripartite-type tricarboxylate transporter receptor subunit TctC
MLRSQSGTGFVMVASAALAVTTGMTVVSVQAQVPSDPPYPTRVVRIIEPFAPGGSTDQVTRMLAERLPARLGQPVVIEHRPGAGGTIGMEAAVRAPPDGHTLVVAPVGPWAVNPHLHKLSYDAANDFAMISRLFTMQGLVLVHPSLPVKSVQELILLARKRPGELNYGSSGVGGWGHVSAELFAMLADVRMTHVPYKGSAPALTDLIGGHLQVLFNTVSTTLPHVASGRVRAIAVTGSARLEALPDTPTVAEAGVPGYENTTWSAIGAPGRTPRAVIVRLNREVDAILRTPEVQQLARQQSSTVLGGTPEEAQAHLKAEIAKYGRVIRDAGIGR